MRTVKLFVKTLHAALFLSFLTLSAAAYAGVVDKVIVVVNDEVVTQREFDRIFEPLSESYAASFKGEELDRRLEEARKGLLEQLINAKLTVSIAKKQNIKVEQSEVQGKIDKIKEYYRSEEDFLRDLNSKGTNLSEFEREIQDQMLAQKLVEKEIASKIVITPKEVQDLYQKNKDKLVAPKMVRVREIMIKKPEVTGDDAARKKMKQMISEIKKGKDFSEVAGEQSEGPFAAEGGDMGYVPEGQMLPEIDKAIFSLSKGEMSEMIETPVGYHVFLAEDIQDPRALEFQEVSDFLREQLYKKQFETKLIGWLEEKRKNAYISYK